MVNYGAIVRENINELRYIATKHTFQVSGAMTNTATIDSQFASGSQTTAMVVDSSGNVGIGTSVPMAKFHVNGDIQTPALVGFVAFFAKNTPPTGWLKCNGTAVSRTTYSALFAVIGITYGAGDGSTTFTLPDLRGEFLRGWDDARGIDSGRSFATAQTDAMQGHYHSKTDPGHAHTTTAYWNNTSSMYTYNAGQIGNAFAVQASITSSSVATGLTITSPSTDGTNGVPRTAAETRSRNFALLACIKY